MLYKNCSLLMLTIMSLTDGKKWDLIVTCYLTDWLNTISDFNEQLTEFKRLGKVRGWNLFCSKNVVVNGTMH